MLRISYILIFCFLWLFSFNCHSDKLTVLDDGLAVADDTVSFSMLGKHSDKEVVITKTIDLQNKKCVIPPGMSLVFKGGIIKNGTLEGNATKIVYNGICFSRVRIIGSWNVPLIKSSMFEDLSYSNALKDVVALSNPCVVNKIVIAKGSYKVKAQRSGDICLLLNSETEFILDGEIELAPNDYKSYCIIYVKGRNIKIRGNGVIAGDKKTHKGEDGEWGMGVRFHRAFTSSVDGITIKDCWGDCIYVGGCSKKIEIKNCLLDHGRRQGISITNADGVFVRNCKITNIGGKAPEYAIDIEPNKGDFVNNVLIEDVDVHDCKGGFLIAGGADSTRTFIGIVEIKNCLVSAKGKYPIRAIRNRELLVSRCNINGISNKPAIGLESVGNVVVSNNNICIEQKIFSSLRKTNYSAIKDSKCSKKLLRNNKIVIQ